jgi:hypothetical protein
MVCFLVEAHKARAMLAVKRSHRFHLVKLIDHERTCSRQPMIECLALVYLREEQKSATLALECEEVDAVKM